MSTYENNADSHDVIKHIENRIRKASSEEEIKSLSTLYTLAIIDPAEARQILGLIPYDANQNATSPMVDDVLNAQDLLVDPILATTSQINQSAVRPTALKAPKPPKINTPTKIAGGLALLLVAYVNFSSPDKVVITETGVISGIINTARELVQGKTFWQGQLNAITAKLNKLEAEPAETAKMNREIEDMLIESQLDEEKMYRDCPDTRPSEAKRQAEALRDKADSIEQAEWDRTMEKERLERIVSLRKIYALVALRAR